MNRERSLAVAALVALALAATGNSIANGFTYDDVGLIQNAGRMHSMDGWWKEFARTYWPGADGYRPLTILAFRIEWVIGDGSPMVFHAVNILLHAVTVVLVHWMALAFLPPLAAWVGAALYAVHPVHVEAIANVVGQSELVVALLVTIALGLYLHGRRAGELSRSRWAGIIALYGVALLFKEHAIVLPALILLAEATAVRDSRPLRQRMLATRLPMLVSLLVAMLYLWPRSIVVGGFSGFAPDSVFWSVDLSATDRILTMIGASTEWLRLMLWPGRLMVHYSPPYIHVAHGFDLALLPGLLVMVGVVGLMLATWRTSAVTAFGIGWLIITLLPVSNLVIPAGFIIAERTLLLPSIGAMLAVASAVPWLVGRIGQRPARQFAATAVVAAILALGIGRSVTRNPVWAHEEALIRQGVIDSPDSYRAHMHLGVFEFSSGRYREGEAAYRRAIALWPHDPLMAWAFAEHLRTAGNCDAAIPIYKWIFSVEPEGRKGHMGYAACMVRRRNYDEAERETLLWLSRGGRLSLARELLAMVKAGRDSLEGATPR